MTGAPHVSVHLVAAARPNFMKIAPLYHKLSKQEWCEVTIVHTGQHYDPRMSDSFFKDLRLPQADIHLGVGSGTHAEQTGRVMMAYEEVCSRARPDWIIVVGDVNSTMACALVGTKLDIPVAHLEAGLRSGDRSMPEEINRLVTDAVADLLWTPSADANENLIREGVSRDRVDFVGNIMIDSLELLAPRIRSAEMASRLGMEKQGYGMLTLHRPSNVDDAAKLGRIVDKLVDIAELSPIIFPAHPRTMERLERFSLDSRLESCAEVKVMKPLGYIDFMSLVVDCTFVLTDSGGIQEETSYLGIPCLTLRDNTERPVTLTIGTNQLTRVESVVGDVRKLLANKRRQRPVIERWDGATAGRIVSSLRKRCLG